MTEHTALCNNDRSFDTLSIIHIVSFYKYMNSILFNEGKYAFELVI